jgi:hypothetical protein
MMPKRRGESAKLTKKQRRELMLKLKAQALDGDMQAANTLSNFELAELTRTRLYRDMDNASAA